MATKKTTRRGGFGQTGRRIATSEVYAKHAGEAAAKKRRALMAKKNPRTVQAVATRTIRKGETFRIKVR